MARKPKSRSGSVGRLTYQPAAHERLVPKTLEFIRSHLPVWRDDPRRPRDSSEKRLNSSLCDFLDIRARLDFPMVRFKHEAPQTETRTADLGVHGIEEITIIGVHQYTIYDAFLAIECKRLPPPSKDREREYVTGTNRASGGATGDIQRFKLGLHGASVENAALVGYIEEHSATHWHRTINQWITDLVGKTSSDGCVWNQSDLLQSLDCNAEQGTSAVDSIHQRMSGCLTPSIRMCHLWVVMAPEAL